MTGPDKAVPAVFLEQIHPDYRGAAGGRFYQAIRAGAMTPQAVVYAVESGIEDLLDDPAAESSMKLWLKILYRVIGENRAAALGFATQCIEREALPKAERAAQKAAVVSEAQRAWMRRQAPTEPQLGRIRAMGSSEVPSDRLAASDLIEKLQAMRRPSR